LGGGVRGRRVVHGRGSGGPDPARDRQEPPCLAEPGRAAVHQLLRVHRHLDARLQRRRQPDRHQTHTARRPGPDHRVQRRRGRVEQRRRDRRAARRVGSRERAVHRHRAIGDRRFGQRRRRRRRRALRGGTRPRDLRRAAARRRARRDQLARPVLRRRAVDDDRVRDGQRVPAPHTPAAQKRARLDRRAAARAASPRSCAAAG
jgi:hypothetical protein